MAAIKINGPTAMKIVTRYRDSFFMTQGTDEVEKPPVSMERARSARTITGMTRRARPSLRSTDAASIRKVFTQLTQSARSKAAHPS